MQWARRRWAPFEGLLLRNMEDVEVHTPHLLQWLRRYRYLRHLRKSFQPRPADAARFETFSRGLKPKPAVMIFWLLVGYAYAYPVVIGAAIAAGLCRGRWATRVSGGDTEPTMPNTTDTILAGLDAGLVVQVHGQSASTAVRRFAAEAPWPVVYVTSTEPRETAGRRELYPVQCVDLYFFLMQLQTRALLWAFREGFLRPLTIVIDANAPSVDEAKMRDHLRLLVLSEGACRVVYTNSAKPSLRFLATEKVDTANKVAVIMSDTTRVVRGIEGGDVPSLCALRDQALAKRAAEAAKAPWVVAAARSAAAAAVGYVPWIASTPSSS